VNSHLTNQDGTTADAASNERGAFRTDRGSVERRAAQRYLSVVAAEARRSRCRLRSPAQPSRGGALDAAPQDVVIEVVGPLDEPVWTIRAQFRESGGN
jgi:hypothetical protein